MQNKFNRKVGEPAFYKNTTFFLENLILLFIEDIDYGDFPTFPSFH